MHAGRTVVGIILALCAQSSFATCYFVYSKSHQLLYRSIKPPVDLALPLHQTVPALGPELALVFTSSHNGCEGSLDMLKNYRSSDAASRVTGRKKT